MVYFLQKELVKSVKKVVVVFLNIPVIIWNLNLRNMFVESLALFFSYEVSMSVFVNNTISTVSLKPNKIPIKFHILYLKN